jgi:peptidyl-prolyl cis-trans isomerase C
MMLHSIFTPLRRRCALALAPLALCLFTAADPAAAADDAHGVLFSGPAAQVSTDDVLFELNQARIAPAERTRILGDENTLRSVIDTIYLRRALAARALKEGLDKDPAIAYRLNTVRDGSLADAVLMHLNAETAAALSPQVLEQQALDQFKAEPERFSTPELTHASHILIAGSDAAAHAKAEDLLKQLKAGAKFEDLARANSADPGSAGKGGDLGFFPAGRMVPQFDEALAKLKNPGDLSDVVQTRFGLHIIRLDERKPAEYKTFDQVKEQLEQDLSNKAQAKARQDAVEALRAQGKGDTALLDAFIADQKAKQPAAPAAATPAPAAAK